MNYLWPQLAGDNPANLSGTGIRGESLVPGSEVGLILFDQIETDEEPSGPRLIPRATLVGDEVVFGD